MGSELIGCWHGLCLNCVDIPTAGASATLNAEFVHIGDVVALLGLDVRTVEWPALEQVAVRLGIGFGYWYQTACARAAFSSDRSDGNSHGLSCA